MVRHRDFWVEDPPKKIWPLTHCRNDEQVICKRNNIHYCNTSFLIWINLCLVNSWLHYRSGNHRIWDAFETELVPEKHIRLVTLIAKGWELVFKEADLVNIINYHPQSKHRSNARPLKVILHRNNKQYDIVYAYSDKTQLFDLAYTNSYWHTNLPLINLQKKNNHASQSQLTW